MFVIKFYIESLEHIFFLRNFATDQASHVVAGRVKQLYGILRLSTPSVRTAKGKGRFLNVTICKFKLRKLESKCRCNATGASARVYYIPVQYVTVSIREMYHLYRFVIISLGVGWLALLILRKRQCEGLNVGIGAEE